MPSNHRQHPVAWGLVGASGCGALFSLLYHREVTGQVPGDALLAAGLSVGIALLVAILLTPRAGAVRLAQWGVLLACVAAPVVGPRIFELVIGTACMIALVGAAAAMGRGVARLLGASARRAA